jgi:hypothetical protein
MDLAIMIAAIAAIELRNSGSFIMRNASTLAIVSVRASA